MCGIVAILRRPSGRNAPDGSALIAELDRFGELAADPASLASTADRLEGFDVALRGVPGLQTLLGDPDVTAEIESRTLELQDRIGGFEADLDDAGIDAAELELINAELLRVKDALWAIRNDRIRTSRAVADLAGPGAGPGALAGALSIQVALSAIDRLEVRGRDSAGIEVLAHRSVGPPEVFTYKTAAEIGELGDNTAELRRVIRDDTGLWRALEPDGMQVLVLGHTRWASIGTITEANAHPVDQREAGLTEVPHVAVAQNGDVDNYADFLADISLPPEITTDAKVVPVLVARRLASGATFVDAFRSTVAGLEGSLAIAACSTMAPDQLLLSLRGSGQALYVGFADESFVVASEPYGLVEEARRYVRVDGETPADPENPVATRGPVVMLDARRAGEIDGIARWSFDGTPLSVDEAELR